MDRLNEPSTFAGLGLIMNGISQCMAKDYMTGITNIVAGMFAVWKREAVK